MIFHWFMEVTLWLCCEVAICFALACDSTMKLELIK